MELTAEALGSLTHADHSDMSIRRGSNDLGVEADSVVPYFQPEPIRFEEQVDFYLLRPGVDQYVVQSLLAIR